MRADLALPFQPVLSRYDRRINKSSEGIRINRVTYNAFGYADDALLASLTSSGLQNRIDCAVQYVTKFQLSFNPLLSSSKERTHLQEI